MKIAFITGCLEPGCSGVGDYTLDLALAAVQAGHECLLIAFNDECVDDVEKSFGFADGQSARIESLRLAARLPWEQREELVQKTLKDFNPDWISLQFVCYGYDPRGLIWDLAGRLWRLCRGRKVHVMFHELWIGESIGTPLKHRVVGSLQKWLILGLIRKLCPAIVHANCSTYVEVLGRNNVAAECLPLFGSIPIAAEKADRWLFPALAKNGLNISTQTRSKFWFFGIFGSLHSEWEPEPFVSYILDAARAENKEVVMIAVGQKGAAGDRLWRELMDRYRGRLHFFNMGKKASQAVSETLLSLDFGIAATPAALIGKSASTAAMLEHGLPVIITRDDYRLKVPFEPRELSNPMLVRLTPSLVKNIAGLKRHPPESKREAVAEQFLHAIGALPKGRVLKSPIRKTRCYVAL